MDISVVIPSHRDPAGLYFTFAAAAADLEHSSLHWEIIAVVDGEYHETAKSLKAHQGCRIIKGEFGSPQASRHAGAEVGKGEFIFFLDSHVVPCRDFFLRMMHTARETRAAMVFSPHCTWARGQMGYGYGVDWCGNLWAKDHQTEPTESVPYRVAMMGHGAICVDREKYFAAGGYWLEQRGWGGEENHLALKLWMLGQECWVEPRVYHWHYMANRRGEAVFRTLEHVRNFLISAYALGGQRYLDRVYLNYTLGANAVPAGQRPEAQDPYGVLYRAAPAEAAVERQRIFDGPFGGDLDKLREFFRHENIHS
jgi:GT2 family glycosyltransferase